MRDRILERFRQGAPSNDLNTAGVLIHMFDDHLDPNEPWHTIQTGWMASYSNILSCSLVNMRKSGAFNSPTAQRGGVVLSPASRVLCSYPYDGGAMNYEWGCGPAMCSEPDNIWNCAFPMSMLSRMMVLHENGPQWPYNEVVVDQSQMVIEAVWGGADARAMHARLLTHYGRDETQLPFLGSGWPFVG